MISSSLSDGLNFARDIHSLLRTYPFLKDASFQQGSFVSSILLVGKDGRQELIEFERFDFEEAIISNLKKALQSLSRPPEPQAPTSGSPLFIE